MECSVEKLIRTHEADGRSDVVGGGIRVVRTIKREAGTLLCRVEHVLYNVRDGRNTGWKIVDLVLQISIGSCAGSNLIGDGTRIGCNVRVVGVDLSLETSVGGSAGGSLIGNGRGVRGDGASVGRDVRSVAVNLTLKTRIRIGTVHGLLRRHRSQAVGFGLRSTGRIQGNRH